MTRCRSFLGHFELLFIAVVALAFLGAFTPATPGAWAKAASQAQTQKAAPNGARASKPSAVKKGSPAKKKPAVAKKATRKKAKAKPKAKAANLPWPNNLLNLVGDGAVLVTDAHAPQGEPRELYAHNAGRKYVPASILKIVTSAAALEFFGPDFRFKTEFLLTRDRDLWVVGYGDPYLVSEELVSVVQELRDRGLREVRDVYVDSSYFERGLILDGNTQTGNPYDAYNGAVAVNFNTLNFKKNKNGQTERSNKETPLTPMIMEAAKKIKNKKTTYYCLNISESPAAAELHAGQTLKAHLEDGGVKVTGRVVTGRAAPANRKVFLTHFSSKTLDYVVKNLMKYSNNFMTNQIFLALGAAAYGAPGNLAKSQRAMDDYFRRHGLSRIVMGDGSGLSRQTTLSARQMADVLAALEDNREIFSTRYDGQTPCKTGTMSDIKTLAGYLERPGDPGRPLSFVILMNGKSYTGGARTEALDILKKQFLGGKKL